jgi:hypothetical protein
MILRFPSSQRAGKLYIDKLTQLLHCKKKLNLLFCFRTVLLKEVSIAKSLRVSKEIIFRMQVYLRGILILLV